jgi:histidinol-phosphate aminotransferase
LLKPRKCLLEIREYHSPLGSDVKLRLDMNENTTGCSPRVLAKLQSMDTKKLALYPPREPGERLVAAYFGVGSSQVILTNGADEGIDLVCRGYLEPGDDVIIVPPTFAMYEVFAQAAGANIVRVPAGEDFAFPVEEVIQAVTPKTRLIFITNPNNPTGAMVNRFSIVKIAQAAPDAAVLADEAYFEFCGQSVMDQIGKLKNIFIVRTFSKAFGMAGMRLGALAGASEHISVLRRMCPPFNVNACVLECLKEALTDRQFVNDYVTQVRETREWTEKQLEELGFKCWPSQGNFVLCRFGEHKAAILETMLECGVALRDRPDCEGCVRISIGTQKEMEQVLYLLKEIASRITAAEHPELQVAPDAEPTSGPETTSEPEATPEVEK